MTNRQPSLYGTVLGNAYGWEPNNKWGTRRYNLDAFGSGTFRTWLVGKQVSDEKLARVLTMWNDANTAALNDPFWSKVRFGIEGVHYTWSGEPWNSARIQTDATKIPPHYSRYGGFIGIFSTGGPTCSLMKRSRKLQEGFTKKNGTNTTALSPSSTGAPHMYLTI